MEVDVCVFVVCVVVGDGVELDFDVVGFEVFDCVFDCVVLDEV